MKKGKDIAARFGGLYLVHQNVPGKLVGPTQYNQHILFIPLQGEIAVETNSRKIVIGLGQMLYLPPKTVHSFSSSDRFGERLIAMADAKLFHTVLETPIKIPLNQFVKELLFYLLLHPKSKGAKALVAVFIETLAEALTGSLSTADIELDHLMGKISDRRIRDSLTFMQDNLAEALNMKTVAQNAGLSGRNFNRLIIKETGRQPKQWLIQLRMARAQELLKVPNASVTDVAYAVGYNSLSQFISTFRAHTGQLPSEYIKHG